MLKMLGIIKGVKMPQKNELREQLAKLEHEQWQNWSQKVTSEVMDDILSVYEIGQRFVQKHQKWLPNWKPYDELDERTKDFDREWADKVLNSIKCKKHNLGSIFCMDCVNEGEVIFVSSDEKQKYKIFKKGDYRSNEEVKKIINDVIGRFNGTEQGKILKKEFYEKLGL